MFHVLTDKDRHYKALKQILNFVLWEILRQNFGPKIDSILILTGTPINLSFQTRNSNLTHLRTFYVSTQSILRVATRLSFL